MGEANRSAGRHHVGDVEWTSHSPEELAREHAAAVAEKERALSLLHLVLTTAPVGFAYLDHDLRYVLINQFLSHLNNLPIEAHAGRHVSDVLPPELAQVTIRCATCVLQSNQPILSVALSATRHAGRCFMCDFYPVHGRDHSILGVGVVVMDVTDMKLAEQRAEKAQRAAEAANRAKDQFLAVLSHELRTPMTPVLITVTAMAEDENLPADVRAQLAMVRRNVEMQARLIDDLLDLTRVSEGKLQFHKRPIDARLPIGNALETCLSEIRQRQLAVAVELEVDKPFVLADSIRLQQVVCNLLKNATKFTPPQGKIVLRCTNDDQDRLSIQVRDTGVGIDPAFLPRIFDPFEQGGSSRSLGGLGLGLTIARALVAAHDGTIHAHSDGPGTGATFTVTLPTIEAVSEPQPPAPAFTDDHARGARLLLVEDHSDTARAMQRLLILAGYQADVANCAAQATDLWNQHRYDLLISDIGLPDESGLDLIRKLSTAGPIPSIALSGYGTEEDVHRCMDAGFTMHLTKPINLQELRAAIEQLQRATVHG